MKRLLIAILTLSVFSSNVCSAQRLSVLLKGDLGYGFSDTEFRGVLAADAGVYADLLLFGPVAVESGLEAKTTGTRVYSELGGLTGGSDFKENYKYRLSYVAIPLCVKLIKEGAWYDGLYAGIGINFPVDGTATYNRTGTGMEGVDAGDTYKIKNLNSPVISSRLGFDQRYGGKWGFHFEIENLYNPINRASGTKTRCNTFKFGCIYYL